MTRAGTRTARWMGRGEASGAQLLATATLRSSASLQSPLVQSAASPRAVIGQLALNPLPARFEPGLKVPPGGVRPSVHEEGHASRVVADASDRTGASAGPAPVRVA